MLPGGAAYRPRRPLDAIRAGLGYVAEDRRAQSILPDLSVRENLLIAALSVQRSSLSYATALGANAPPRWPASSICRSTGSTTRACSAFPAACSKILIMRLFLLEPRVLLLY